MCSIFCISKDEADRYSANQDASFLDIFSRAYKLSRPTGPPKGVDKDEPNAQYFATLYRHSNVLVAAARSIIDKFNETSEATAKLEATSGLQQQVATWEEENESMRQMANWGHLAGVQKVEAMLDGKEGPELDEGDKIFADMLYGIGDNHAGGEMGVGEGPTWGRLVKSTLR